MPDVARLSEALVAAQRDMPVLTKDAHADDVAKSGARYSYGYLSLPELLDAVLPVLNAHGLALMQMPAYWEGIDVLWTHLRHVSGDEVKSPMRIPAPAGATAQEFGSALTYARRYAVLSFLGLAPDDDDDGAVASRHKPAQRAAAPPVEPKPSADEKQATSGQFKRVNETLEMLQHTYPEAPGQGRTWHDVAKRHSIDRWVKDDAALLTMAEANELADWLEEQGRMLREDSEAPYA